MSHPDILDIKLSKDALKVVDFKNKIARNTEVNVAFLRNFFNEPLIPHTLSNNVLRIILRQNIYSCE